jgi:hypothetical protein
MNSRLKLLISLEVHAKQQSSKAAKIFYYITGSKKGLQNSFAALLLCSSA